MAACSGSRTVRYDRENYCTRLVRYACTFQGTRQTHKEDISTGAESAAYGGFTGVLCMPNTNPAVDSKEVLESNIGKSKDNIVDIYHSGCATKGRAGKENTNVKELVESGAIAITMMEARWKMMN